jgi:hypothetical protein
MDWRKKGWYTWTGLHLIREPFGKSGLKDGTAGESWRVNTVRTEPRGRKKIPITCVTNRALGKVETAVQREQFSIAGQ